MSILWAWVCTFTVSFGLSLQAQWFQIWRPEDLNTCWLLFDKKQFQHRTPPKTETNCFTFLFVYILKNKDTT